MMIFFRKTLVATFFLLVPFLAFCEDPGLFDFGYGDPDAVPAEVPIDDGLIWLLAAAVLYGIYMARKRHKKPASSVV